MYPSQAPWTGIGALQSEISSLKSELSRKAESYEVSQINSRVDGLERSLGEIRSSIDGFLIELQNLRENQIGTP